MGILEGKVGIVTGAGQGVGQGIAFALAGEGCAVVVAGRTESKLIATCNEIENRGGKAIPVVYDVRNKEHIEAWVQSMPGEDEAFLKMVPLGRIGDCEKDIGRAVVFLVGPDAGHITGSTMMLDGGQSFLR